VKVLVPGIRGADGEERAKGACHEDESGGSLIHTCGAMHRNRRAGVAHPRRAGTCPRGPPSAGGVLDQSGVYAFTRGWIGYLRLATVPHPFVVLDQWLCRRSGKSPGSNGANPRPSTARWWPRCRRGACTQGRSHRPMGLVECGGLPHARRRAQPVIGRVGLLSQLDQLRVWRDPREPPCTVPDARWCGMTGGASLPPTNGC
jgi:hypothetical protein